MQTPELAVIGLTCNVVGVFFLANSIRLREPHKAMEDAMGMGVKSLERVRDTALNNMQVMIGFLFLTAGFLLQTLGTWEGVADEILTLGFCAGIIAVAVLVYAIGAYSSRRAFRKLLRQFFQNHAWSFTDNMALTKEVGEMLGVVHTPDMTVEEYVHKVRLALGVSAQPKQGNGIGDRSRRLRDMSPLAPR